jgi:hypothetical protein
MAALVSEIKARQAAKATKSRTSLNPSIGGIPSPSEDDPSSSSVRAGPVGGIMLGERGKEMIRDRNQGGGETSSSSSTTTSKENGSWFGGRI